MPNTIKRWKLSPIDIESRRHWVDYSQAKDLMFARTDTKVSPWYVVNSDNKKQARLNCIAHLLSRVPYNDLNPVEIALPPRQSDSDYKSKDNESALRAGNLLTAADVTLRTHSIGYLVAITALWGPASGTTRQFANPASLIQPMQSAPV